MEATVNESYPSKSLTSCGGLEFVKGSWRGVPVAYEAEAKRHPFLDVREPVENNPVEAPEPETTETGPQTAETSSEPAQAELAAIEPEAEAVQAEPEGVEAEAESKPTAKNSRGRGGKGGKKAEAGPEGVE